MDYNERVKALRRCVNEDKICTTEDNCGYLGKGEFCTDALMSDAADALETLQAQLPKRGKWIITVETSDDGAVLHHMNCSVCGFYWREPKHRKVFKRCPNCGAKMGVHG